MFDGKYLDWNQKRIKGIIDFYGHKFMYSKRVLDLGCGHADISGVLYRLGADVTALDVRQEHLQIASKKFPGIKTVKADLDRGWPFYGKQFDLILDLDLICHLNNYEAHLRAVCASTNYLILETTVCDSNDPHKNIVLSENKNVYDLSANGVSSRPSAAAIERVLTECGMNFKRQDNARYNSGAYIYDWQSKDNDDCDLNKRRIWFASKSSLPEQIEIIPPKPILMAPPAVAGNVTTLENTRIPVTQAYVLNSTASVSTAGSKKVKTALCISGHLRTFEENYPSVKENILNKLDCDVFIHTWDILGLSYRFDANLYKVETAKIMDRINRLYAPKKIIIEQTKNFTATPLMYQRLVDHRDIPGILSMFYKIEACNTLKKEYELENKFIYDCVIRFRGDLWVERPFPINEFTNLNYLFVPIYGNFSGICDQLAYGSSNIMDKYSSLYSNLQKYLEAGAILNPERILQYHVDINQIPVSKVDLKFLIKRANGLVQDNMLLERALGFIR